MLEVFILSIVQGITEFLPISSSAHLVLITKITNFSFGGLLLDISLHIGSFLAVLIYFRKEIIEMLFNFKKLSFLIIAVTPILILGFFISQTTIVDSLRNLKVIGWMTVIFGIFLFLSDKVEVKKNYSENFNFKDALIIGLIHCFAIIPGVSRSGVSITTCRFLSYDRVNSAKISFLISIPTLFAVSIFGIYNLSFNEVIDVKKINVISIFSSFVFSYLTIKFFLEYLKKFTLSFFVYYRVIIGLIILYYAYN
ncbi:MAG: UDP-diphosphatase [Candidatus Pelagibacter sp.]|nr:UDP-diphosphatase [Candidatus Pelagibacter sp.]OUW23415.1 MAG: UDP-diphosphatase [Rickettsiales bacterium TMED174]